MLRKLPNLVKLTFTLLIGGLLFTACDDDSSSPSIDFNVLETIQSQDNLSSFDGLISEYELADTLAKDNPHTVFAPTDNTLDGAGLDELSEDEILELLKYHIVPQDLSFEDLQEIETLETLSGAELQLSFENDTLSINEGQVIITGSGLDASNGTVFKTDSVLTPEVQEATF